MIKIRASTARRLGVLAVGVLALTAALSGWNTAGAVNFGTVGFVPSSPTVLAGNSFTLSIESTSTATTSAVQADVVFDITKAQVTNVTRGTGYDGTTVNGFPAAATIGLGFLDTPADKAAAIAAANGGGVLQGTSVYYNPAGGDVPVPAGTRQAFVVTMTATVNITVASVISLTNLDMVDGVTPLPSPMVVNNTCSEVPPPPVTVTSGTATGSTATTMTNASAIWGTNAYAGLTVTMGGSTGTILSNTVTVLTINAWAPLAPVTGPYVVSAPGLETFRSTCTGSLAIVNSATSVTAGATFTASIQQTSAAYTSGIQADLLIDRSKVKVTNVARGLAYSSPVSGGTVGLGFLDVLADKQAAMLNANTVTGVLQGIALYYSPSGGDPVLYPGTTTGIIVVLEALVNVNNTDLVVGVQRAEMLDPFGFSMTVTFPRNHAIDPNRDGYSAADEVTPANCSVASCGSITTFGTAETRTCKDPARVCGTPNPVADELGATRVAIPPATGYGCSVTLDTVGSLKTTKLAQSDIDLDGSASILDLSKVASWFGNAVNASSTDPRWEGNMDGDGSISILDLSAIAANFGRSVANNCLVQ